MRKVLAFFLSISMALGVCACGKLAEEPIYHSEEELTIGMWVGVPDVHYTYDEDGNVVGSGVAVADEKLDALYRDIADSGVNLAFPAYMNMGDGNTYAPGITETYNIRVLKAAEKVGIKHLIADGALKSYLMQLGAKIGDKTITEEQAIERIRAMVAPYTKYKSMAGFMIQDEPNSTYFDALGFAEKIFRKAAPDLMFYTNLFPVIATGNQLGGGASVNYNSYIAQYLEKIKTDYLSYDHYPLYIRGDETSLEASFLYNMDLVRRQIDNEGKNREIWTFLQSIPFNKNREITSKGDIAFQTYSFLAYGGDAIQWFCYASPPPFDGATHFGEGMIDRNLEKTDTYGYVQAVNKEMQAMMPYYKNFTWNGVMLSDVNGGEGNFAYITQAMSSTDTLLKLSSTDDAFSGIFTDKDGREGYMVVNFTDPANNISNDVTLELNGAMTQAIVVKNGVKTIEKVKKGKLTLKFDKGEAAFVIPY